MQVYTKLTSTDKATCLWRQSVLEKSIKLPNFQQSQHIMLNSDSTLYFEHEISRCNLTVVGGARRGEGGAVGGAELGFCCCLADGRNPELSSKMLV